MSSGKALDKTSPKYHCMVSGSKVMNPCSDCSNPKGCLSRAMQYKENEEMENLDEKAIVKINADGEVSKCAKGLDAGECGYKAGAKVCGACGAMPVMAKGGMPDDEMMDEEEMPKKAKKRMMVDAEMGEDDMEDDELPVKGKKQMMEGDEMPFDEDEDEDEEDEEEDEKSVARGVVGGYGRRAVTNRRRRGGGRKRRRKEDEVEDSDEIMEEDEDEAMMKPRPNDRTRAMQAMGMKSVEIAEIDDAYLCQIERKVYSGTTDVCSGCKGGCAPEEGMPGLLDIEGMALDLFGGKVLSSGYSDSADLYVVDLLAKDGRAVELIADGTTGEIMNFHRLNPSDMGDVLSEKSADGSASRKIIDIVDAEEIALKALSNEVKTDGVVVQADSDIFEGFDSYVFEIDGVNGKSYDVFVGVDGVVLGYDEYEAGEAEEIEAEAAEIALKRAYGDDDREAMAESGMALPDGSYPIKDVTDLRNAIQAFGRAKDKDKAKAHIMKRARDLGQEEMIPENWSSGEKTADGEDTAVEWDDSDQFMKSLMEFQLLEIEEELKDKF